VRVLHIISSLDLGGAESIMYQLIQLSDPLNSVVVSIRDSGAYGSRLENLGVEVICLNAHGVNSTFFCMAKLWKIIKGNDYDLIQTWMAHANFLGGLLAFGLRKPVVWGIHASTLEAKSPLLTRVITHLNGVLSWVVPRAIICCAHSARRFHAHMKYSKRKMVVIQNGYDTCAFRPNSQSRLEFRLSIGAKDDDILLGMVARYDPYKDHSNLFESLEFLNSRNISFKCVLVGDYITYNNRSLMADVSRYGLDRTVFLLGPFDNIPMVMNGIDIHVLSSLSEAFPNVLAEAMACGVPCVSTDVGDVKVILGETGWFCPPRNPKLLADALESAITELSQPSWEHRSLAARVRICKKFSAQTMRNRYEKIWSVAIS